MEQAHSAAQPPEGTLRALMQAAVVRSVGIGAAQPDQTHGHHVPYFDTEYDALFLRTTEAQSATRALANLEIVQRLYGSAEAPRLLLYFLYEYFTSIGLTVEAEGFARLWSAFWTELNEPNWKMVAVTNLANFDCDATLDAPVLLGDGISVLCRSHQTTVSIGGEALWQSLAEDWSAIEAGSFILTAEVTAPKVPDNIVMSSDLKSPQRLAQAVLGLRLANAGDLRHGRVFLVRQMHFPFVLGGRFSVGVASQWQPGSVYQLDERVIGSFRELYPLLDRDREELSKAWSNVATAMRSFNELFERTRGQQEDKILDAVTAIEALVGDKSETTFKVAQRVAWILAKDSDERVRILKDMKTFYDVRSAIVHGGDMKPKHQTVIADPSVLVNIARQLLVGFIRLSAAGLYSKGAGLKDELDEILIHDSKRALLQNRLGIA